MIRDLRWSRLATLTAAVALTAVLAIRPTPVKADRDGGGGYQGQGSTHVHITFGHVDTEEHSQSPLDVWTRAIYSSRASAWVDGLALRMTFPIPSADRMALLTLDLERQDGEVTLDDDELATATYREFPSEAPDDILFEGLISEGSVRMTRVIEDSRLIGFRLDGTFTVIDLGDDAALGSLDETRVIHVEIDAGAASAYKEGRPAPICDNDCWVDPEWSGESEVYVETGCGWEVYDDDYSYDEPDPTSDSGGCEADDFDEPSGDDYYYDDSSYDDDGSCEGDSYDDSDSYDSYDSSDTGSCEGDSYDDGSSSSEGLDCDSDSSDTDDWDDSTWADAPAEQPKRLNLPWWVLLGLLGTTLLAHRKPSSNDPDC